MALGLLGSHVAGRAQNHIGARQAGVSLEKLGQSEVGDLGGLVIVQKDVGRLQVAVDDSHAVGIGDGPGKGFDHPRGIKGSPRGAVDQLGQAAAGHELHLEIEPAGMLVDVKDLDDIRVAEPGGRLGLGQETDGGFRGCEVAGEQHLERDGSIELELAGLEHHAHAAAPDLAQDLVSGHQGRDQGQPRLVAGDRTPRQLFRDSISLDGRARKCGVLRLLAQRGLPAGFAGGRLSISGPGQVAGVDRVFEIAAGRSLGVVRSSLVHSRGLILRGRSRCPGITRPPGKRTPCGDPTSPLPLAAVVMARLLPLIGTRVSLSWQGMGRSTWNQAHADPQRGFGCEFGRKADTHRSSRPDGNTPRVGCASG